MMNLTENEKKAVGAIVMTCGFYAGGMNECGGEVWSDEAVDKIEYYLNTSRHAGAGYIASLVKKGYMYRAIGLGFTQPEYYEEAIDWAWFYGFATEKRAPQRLNGKKSKERA